MSFGYVPNKPLKCQRSLQKKKNKLRMPKGILSHRHAALSYDYDHENSEISLTRIVESSATVRYD